MRVVVTGAGGQLGHALRAAFAHDELYPLSSSQLDVTDRDAVLGTLTTVVPDVVVHAAAWTAVDACEADPDRAFAVNALGCRHVAEGCALSGAYLCAISTDYVFDGRSERPYTEWDPTNPQSVYGRSKLGGELEVQASGARAAVVRTSWLCGTGGSNFVATMVRLARASADPVRVVDDQRGCPTFTEDLAAAVRSLAASRRPGTFHVTNQGATSWHGFAQAVFAAAGADDDRVLPVSTAELTPPRPAPRPANSVLDNAALRLSGLTLLPDYHEPLERLVKELLS